MGKGKTKKINPKADCKSIEIKNSDKDKESEALSPKMKNTNPKVKENESKPKPDKVELESPEKLTIPTPKETNIAKKKAKKRKHGDGNEISTEVGGFTVIGDVGQYKRQNVKRVLPEWLLNPSIVSSNLKDDIVPLSSLNLCPQLAKTLEKNFITYLFPVQAQVIPWLIDSYSPKLLRPSDICVSACTGSGKTLAYVLPIVQVLRNAIRPTIRAIVVLPTEMLATQVHTVFQKYCAGTTLKVFLMSKRLSLTAEKKALIKQSLNGEFRCPYDIIVSTPGRLVDHLEQTEGFDITNLKFLVVDEADRTLDDQEGDWLQRLEARFWSRHSPGRFNPKTLQLTVKSLPLNEIAFQKLLFSATLSQNPEKLAKLNLFQPKLFTSIVESLSNPDEAQGSINSRETQILDTFAGKFTTPQELKESYVLCHKETKPLILIHLIKKNNWKRVLCFVNTNDSTHRLCLLLQKFGLNVKEVSSKWSPQTRDMVVKKFINGNIDILVTSDQMARGIDIPMVDYVISYDLPGFTKTYIHRTGRTARAGKEGSAISLIEQTQIGLFKRIMKNSGKPKLNKMTVRNSDLKQYEAEFQEALGKLKVQLETEAAPPNKKQKIKGKFQTKS